MERLEYFATFEDEKNIEKESESDNPQNDFPGIAPGGIHVFEHDIKPSQGKMVDSMMGCRFVMASTKIGLWNFQTQEANLFGINNPFSRKDYTAYLNTLPELAVSMLDECMEQYDLPDEGAIMFGLDGMIKVLPSHLEDCYYIVLPSGDEVLMANPNTKLLHGDILTRMQEYISRNTWSWIKKKVTELNGQPE